MSLPGTPLGAPLPPPDPQEFSSSDYVRVELDQDVLRLMQEGHGGWSSDMGDVSITIKQECSIFVYKFLTHVQCMVAIEHKFMVTWFSEVRHFCHSQVTTQK